MDTQLLRARFTTQEAAESAVRKLASLRSDGIRLERLSSANGPGTPETAAGQVDGGLTATIMAGNDIQVYSGAMAAADVADQEWRVARSGQSAGSSAPAGASEFSLSVYVPGSVADEARNVIQAAGGQMS